MWNQFLTALSFLTLIPVRPSSTSSLGNEDLANTFSFFPVVGFVLGLCVALPALLLTPPLPSLLLAVILTAELAILTRGLHLDGLADLADGIGGGYTMERRLEIMKDSHTGAFGAIALILALALKIASLDAIIRKEHWCALLLVPALSRYAMVLVAYKSRYARPNGLGKPFLEHMGATNLLMATSQAFILAIVLSPTRAPFYGLALLITIPLIRRTTVRLLGGITGDVLGATNELTEVLCFALAASL